MTNLVPKSYLEPQLSDISYFLQDANNIITPHGVNLRPLKKAASMLPDYVPINNSTAYLLQQIQAIVFLTASPTWSQVAEDFLDDNWMPSKEKALSNVDRNNADQLLASLGLPTKVHSAVSGKLRRRI